jgi:hypothetical protein
MARLRLHSSRAPLRFAARGAPFFPSTASLCCSGCALRAPVGSQPRCAAPAMSVAASRPPLHSSRAPLRFAARGCALRAPVGSQPRCAAPAVSVAASRAPLRFAARGCALRAPVESQPRCAAPAVSVAASRAPLRFAARGCALRAPVESQPRCLLRPPCRSRRRRLACDALRRVRIAAMMDGRVGCL